MVQQETIGWRGGSICKVQILVVSDNTGRGAEADDGVRHFLEAEAGCLEICICIGRTRLGRLMLGLNSGMAAEGCEMFPAQ